MSKSGKSALQEEEVESDEDESMFDSLNVKRLATLVRYALHWIGLDLAMRNNIDFNLKTTEWIGMEWIQNKKTNKERDILHFLISGEHRFGFLSPLQAHFAQSNRIEKLRNPQTDQRS